MAITSIVIQFNALTGCSSSNGSSEEKTKTDSVAVKSSAPVTDSVQKVAVVQTASADTTEKDPMKADTLQFAGTLPDTLLPKHRILAYYGNPHSKKMGILGEFPRKEMLRKLDQEAERWQKADPSKPIQKALHLVAISAQGAPGKDGNYRLRMSDKTIRKVISWGAQHGAIVFLDIQVGLAPLKGELAFLEKYLKLPYVHLGIDPEFSMKTGARPGSKIGTYDASDVNDAVQFLSRIVKENNVPPKILVVHRFTQRMVTNYKNIKLDPRVAVVMDMDGWGPPSLKIDSYKDYIVKEPVQYTGFKLFYKNDMKKVDHRSNHKVPHLMEPEEVLALEPKPLYIQYQ
ncbi:lipoprotein [Larkinella knui]